MVFGMALVRSVCRCARQAASGSMCTIIAMVEGTKPPGQYQRRHIGRRVSLEQANPATANKAEQQRKRAKVQGVLHERHW